MTFYDKVVKFSESFDISISKNLLNNDQILDEDKQLIETKRNLINEELNELLEAIDKNNLINIIDALIDMLYVIYGVYYSFEGLTIFNKDFNEYCKKSLVSLDNINNKQFKKYIITQFYNDNIVNDYFFKHFVDNLKLVNVNFNKTIMKKELNTILNDYIDNIFSIFIVLNINPTPFFDEIHNSNMTKFCVNEDEVGLTSKHYQNEFNCNTYYIEKSFFDSKLYIVKRSSDNKILKSINYTKPNINKILQYYIEN